jgi:hypothetical protein
MDVPYWDSHIHHEYVKNKKSAVFNKKDTAVMDDPLV